MASTGIKDNKVESKLEVKKIDFYNLSGTVAFSVSKTRYSEKGKIEGTIITDRDRIYIEKGNKKIMFEKLEAQDLVKALTKILIEEA